MCSVLSVSLKRNRSGSVSAWRKPPIPCLIPASSHIWGCHTCRVRSYNPSMNALSQSKSGNQTYLAPISTRIFFPDASSDAMTLESILPPILSLASRTKTLFPRFTNSAAAAKPEMPAPRTMTSASRPGCDEADMLEDEVEGSDPCSRARPRASGADVDIALAPVTAA